VIAPNPDSGSGGFPASTRSRQAIMDRVRSQVIASEPVQPIGFDEVTTFDDPVQQFVQSLEFVGGKAHFVDQAADVGAVLQQIPVFAEATRISSLFPEGVQGNIDATLIDDPHALATLDWTIAKGEFAVAENGAIWVDGTTLPHRVMLFIAQYLALVVSRSQIVSNLHEAYERIGDPAPGLGIFVSGPSKTADIEQSLVLGAHGCRKLQVFLLP